MPNSSLTGTQKDLYKNLEEAIKNRKDVTNLFIGVSNDDLLAVLTAASILEKFEDANQEHTETLPWLLFIITMKPLKLFYVKLKGKIY